MNVPTSFTPSVRQLRAFRAVFQLRKLSAAAEQLAVTQSAVSVLIRQLEEGLGARLFDRTTRRVVMTPEAVRFKSQAHLVPLGFLYRLARPVAGRLAVRRPVAPRRPRMISCAGCAETSPVGYRTFSQTMCLRIASLAVVALALGSTACGTAIPQIAFDLDECRYCRMIISDERYAAAAITASAPRAALRRSRSRWRVWRLHTAARRRGRARRDVRALGYS